ncbi:zinc finger protein 385A-like [Coccinella septempunctata]|uniref:zinc finger protein 385A-like n=1 Tax=Coccinella septempunctata TaxID=41139 RepID=UPI001D06FAAE|nr:zinc finger protein 385A-like [Coccinella septempunctata]
MSGDLHTAIQEITTEFKSFENLEDNDQQCGSGLECQLCNIKVTSMKILERHLKGKKHRIREAKNGREFFCDICDVRANSEIQLDIHLKSSRHKGNIMKKESSEFTSVSAGTKGIWLIVICLLCLFLNLLLLFRTS